MPHPSPSVRTLVNTLVLLTTIPYCFINAYVNVNNINIPHHNTAVVRRVAAPFGFSSSSRGVEKGRGRMTMGLFPSMVRGGCRDRSFRVSRLVGNGMKRLLNTNRSQPTTKPKPKQTQTSSRYSNLITRSRNRLRSLRYYYHKKARTATLAFASLFFAASLLTSSSSSPTTSIESHPSASQTIPTMTTSTRNAGRGGRTTSTAADPYRIIAQTRGGRGMSAANPTKSIRKIASKGPTLATSKHPFRSPSKTKSQSKLRELFLNRGGTATASSTTSSTLSVAESSTDTITATTKKTLRDALSDLQSFIRGAKSDTLLLLLATSLVTPLCKRLGTSPILGFLAAGMALGPNALGWIDGIHSTETLAELGIVFFLFEMGLELSMDRLLSMKKDVFGLGLSQFMVTAAVLASIGSFFGISADALVVLGGGLALSSSAFVLQLLKDNDQLATRFGKASFGVLLFQDLAVVPLLVVTPVLAGGGTGMASAVVSAVVKAAMALGSIAFIGRVVLNPLFATVAQSNSQEAFLGVILLTVLSMSFMTEGLGLSNTLGAFLAGVLLSETKYRYQVEADIAPFRGILLGLFFVTVGFEIDFYLISSKLPVVASIVAGIIFIKTMVTTLLSLAFGLSLSTSSQTGLILSQGGEFAFVAFGLARNLGIFDPAMTKLLLTGVALTMAVTPMLANVGGQLSRKLEESSDFTHYLGQDRDAAEIAESEDFVVVVGYGTVGKVVCDLLDRKLYRYVGLELNPNKAIEARNRGLPVFYGDVGRPEVAEAFNVGSARAVIVTIADKDQANRAVISLRRAFPETKIFARAKDADHAERLQRTLDVIAMVPVVPEDSVLLTLPFGGAVLRSLGAAKEEVNAILEGKRKEILSGKNLAGDNEEKLLLTQLGILTEDTEQASSLSTTSVSSSTSSVSSSSSSSSTSSSTSSSSAASSSSSSSGKKNPNVVDVEVVSEKDTNAKKEQEEQQPPPAPPTSSEVARAAADANKKIAPMVAEVIESAAGKAEKTDKAEKAEKAEKADSEDVNDKDVVSVP